MTDIRDDQSDAQPHCVSGELPIRPGTYLQVAAPRHGRTTLCPAIAALMPSVAARAPPGVRATAVARETGISRTTQARTGAFIPKRGSDRDTTTQSQLIGSLTRTERRTHRLMSVCYLGPTGYG